MAVTETYQFGASVSTTEYSLTSNSTSLGSRSLACVMQVFVDANQMAAGDTFRFRVYEKIAAGGAQRVVYESFLAGAQGTPNWASPSLMVLNGWEATAIKIAGTDRSLSWSIRTIA